MRYDRCVIGQMMTVYGACLAVALVILALASGCGAACQTESRIVDALGTGIDAADEMVGDRGGEEYDRASRIAHGVQGLGRAAVGACETLRDGRDSWRLWLLNASQAAIAIMGIIEGASADIEGDAPIELRRALAMIDWSLSVQP
ncbi:MAG: hypothetical protein GY700_01625 [Propionibacteriaceae bacterium]|nr:hypothetical protein [Propionibacteriaceae bacterium]